MRKIMTIMALLLCITASAQNENWYTLTEVSNGWSKKTISNVPNASIGTLVTRFNDVWHTYDVDRAVGVIKQGLAKKVLDAEMGLEVINDTKNGYVEVSDNGSDDSYMSACVWRRTNGHSLFAICLGQPVDPEIEFVCFYDYDPQKKALTPEPSVLANWLGNRTHLSYGLPQKGKELKITEWDDETSQLLIHHFDWDGMKPVFKSTEVSEMDGGGPDMTFPVTFKGTSPNISDFVNAILSQEELGETLGYVSDNWTRRKQGRKLEDGATWTVDERNGYIRHEAKYDNDKSYTEFCFWNCADGKHKLVASNIGYIQNGKPIDTENTGLMFYSYDNETKELTYTSPYDVGAVVENVTGTVTYALPRVGKNIEATIHTQRPSKVLLKWNGSKFVLE